jgi:hypothetical protein
VVGPLLAAHYFLVEEAHTQQGRAHNRRLHPAGAARPALMGRTAHSVEAKAVVRIEVAVRPRPWLLNGIYPGWPAARSARCLPTSRPLSRPREAGCSPVCHATRLRYSGVLTHHGGSCMAT